MSLPAFDTESTGTNQNVISKKKTKIIRLKLYVQAHLFECCNIRLNNGLTAITILGMCLAVIASYL